MWFESEWKVTMNKKCSEYDLKVKKNNSEWKITVNEKW